ncbi:short-chain dehydrogenase/reductase family Oxidoreductase [Colletotrichum graminicola M1.001]|uniref:Short-chain dehydrogenase/reductase family Oxidoreductase n=1 Tax=Colletotrichum graminicola (strain M1.001 / M2 / FGSC 10212) TaxID=645133 RepID=E3QU29_COLGM|nr:short-chain dehydrogenase/reductase family Oxidoreductase [Colletotrichum graminicola M1.001]EFQ34367.1 short-chain dehydrogenase/reductase family Oxidoreductase [Colletotrichum graminicola M1.001]
MPVLFVYEKDLVDPRPQIPSLEGRSTAGLGKATILALLAHNPLHVYFSGRSLAATEALIASVTASSSSPPPPLTFVQMDLASLATIKPALAASFAHDRLDVLINNAGIMAGPAGLSADGYEIQFATNHLGHAMLVRALLPVLRRAAALPGSDVRVVNLTSVGYQGHPSDGISFATLRTTQAGPPILGQWTRYGRAQSLIGVNNVMATDRENKDTSRQASMSPLPRRQSKLANMLFTRELARLHPSITAVAVHPGTVGTGLVAKQGLLNRLLVHVPNKMAGAPILTPERGCWSQVWAATAAARGDLVSGGFYLPVGRLADNKLDRFATDDELAGELWRWTEGVLAGLD